LLTNTWYYLEFKILCNNTTGTYEVKLGGTQIAALTATGVDTKEGANDYHDNVRFFAQTSARLTIDDLYILDGTAGASDFLGNSRVQTVRPTSDYSVGFETPANGTHYDDVDENPCDDDTTYVEDDDTSDRDLYEYADLTSAPTVTCVQLCADCRETDANTFNIKQPIRSGTTIYSGSPEAVNTTSYITKMRRAETDPDTSNAWTLSGVNSAQFGVEVG
jgi:hypothetical protein